MLSMNCDRDGSADGRLSVYYTRCPVATATGIALEKGILDSLFAGTPYALCNIAGLGGDHANAHYTHSIDRCFREGGGSPPVWARAGGADSRLLGITFMDETLGIFVRSADPAESMLDLAGRRIGLPVWPRLIFNFWRFAAEKGFHSALKCHGMPETAVTVVDVVEGRDSAEYPEGRLAGGEPDLRRCNYRGQLQALLDGRIDAMFGKGLELASLEREASGRIRLLFDVASSPDMIDRVNNSTPRLVTAGARLVNEDREVVIRYLQGLLRAARWAPQHATEARDIIARECAVEARAIDQYLPANYTTMLVPAITAELLGTVEVLKSFLLRRGYLAGDFAVEDWVDPEPLLEAQLREHQRGA